MLRQMTNFILFVNLIIFYCTYIYLYSIFFVLNNIPLPAWAVFLLYAFIDGFLGWFHVLTIITSSTVHTGMQRSFWYASLTFFIFIPKSRLQSNMLILFLGCVSVCLTDWFLYFFCNFSTSLYNGYTLFIFLLMMYFCILISNCYFCLFGKNCSNQGRIVSLCSLDFDFLMLSEVIDWVFLLVPLLCICFSDNTL